MKKEKIKEALGKLGKATLPAMMLLGMAWNANAAIQSLSEPNPAQETKKTKPVVEFVDNESYEKILTADGNFNFSGECFGCDTSCGGCTGGCTGCSGCTGTCSGGCSGGCTGTNTAG